ncbi:hypothetical protein TeGR_g11814 [Tetraparma gracilis]|uniref:Inorganic diphosphatase n=1 Tax=Tetraparma gracilis TaxID=2962635 RepID=A0ABQ6MPZ4_9STRA|nr:hypothetical protein TeGR_g11814 [Tetraparma gracilis]
MLALASSRAARCSLARSLYPASSLDTNTSLHPSTSLRPPSRPSCRSYIGLISVQFSPSHSRSENIRWLVSPGDWVDVYQPLYTCTAYDLSPEEPGKGTPMIVECVDEGYATHLFDVEGSDEPMEVIGVLSKDEEEHARLSKLLGDMPGDVKANQARCLKALGPPPECAVMWNGYLQGKEPPPPKGKNPFDEAIQEAIRLEAKSGSKS